MPPSIAPGGDMGLRPVAMAFQGLTCAISSLLIGFRVKGVIIQMGDMQLQVGQAMIRSSTFSSIITDIYDCAVNPALWPDTLGRITAQMNGAYVALNLLDKASQTGRTSYHSDWDEVWLQRLHDYIFEIPGMQTTLFGPLDAPVSSVNHISEAEVLKSRFHQEWSAPQGLKDGGSCKFVETASVIGIFSFVVSDGRAPITAEERRHIQLLSPHIRRATMIGDLINQKDSLIETFRETLDKLDFPLILTDETGKIHFANQSAAAMLAASNVVRDRQGKLVVNDTARKAALDNALAKAHRGDRDIGLYGIGIPLNREFEVPTVCYVLPLNQSDARHMTGGATVAVFFSSGAGSLPVVEAILSTLYSMTPAEIRVARDIASGDTPRGISERLGSSENTIKTHLKHIFEKTGVSRQSQLVRLLADLSPPASAG